MKRTILFLVLATLLLSAVKVNAQMGFHAGYAPQTLSVINRNVDGDIIDPIRFHGFFGGIHFDLDLVGNLDLNLALQIRMNTASEKGTLYNTENWQFIADLPLQLSYAFELKDDFNLGVFAGPVLSYGISYTQKRTDPVTFELIESINRYGTSQPASSLRRFELNLDGGIFLEYKDFMVFGGYRFGLVDLDKMDDMVTKARGFFVGIGVN